jgi:hypothetical protein
MNHVNKSNTSKESKFCHFCTTLPSHQWVVNLLARCQLRAQAGSLKTVVASKLAKYYLNLQAVQEVRWPEGGSQQYFSVEREL